MIDQLSVAVASDAKPRADAPSASTLTDPPHVPNRSVAPRTVAVSDAMLSPAPLWHLKAAAKDSPTSLTALDQFFDLLPRNFLHEHKSLQRLFG
jgi:hypothetical protein